MNFISETLTTLGGTNGFWENGELAILGGILPSLVWLTFWLTEDRRHPEPKGYIALTFFMGMLVVPLALVYQKWSAMYFVPGSAVLLILWALGEEVLKFVAATLGGLSRRANNEPLDAMVYLITAALGYAALENALFLLGPLQSGDLATAVLAGNFRFLGSTLVHVLGSASIGIFMAYAFCKSRSQKVVSVVLGLLLATSLHGVYNIFILNTEVNFFIIFSGIWAGIAAVLFFFEIVKRFNPYCR